MVGTRRDQKTATGRGYGWAYSRLAVLSSPQPGLPLVRCTGHHGGP